MVYLYHIIASKLKKKITGHVRIFETGSRFDVVSHYTEFRTNKGGGKRGNIEGFSPQSRKRMIDLLCTMDQTALRRALFVTLTYRRNHVTGAEIKSNLKSFLQALRRTYPNSSGIWKLEFQERGSPHYHVAIFERYIPYEWVAARWNRIAEDSHPDHYKAGTEVRRNRSAKNVVAYMSKYLAKVQVRDDSRGNDLPCGSNLVGRYWGAYNRSQLPYSKVRIVPLRGDEARGIIRSELSKWGAGFSGDHVSNVSVYTRGKSDTLRKLSDYNVSSRGDISESMETFTLESNDNQ